MPRLKVLVGLHKTPSARGGAQSASSSPMLHPWAHSPPSQRGHLYAWSLLEGACVCPRLTFLHP